MPEKFTAVERSAVMRAVGSKNTGPEMSVRRLAHSLGYRYALHVESLPGKPDLVFTRRRKVIFVHGCFWHKHVCRRGTIVPVKNREYWITKRDRNRRRDRIQIRELRGDGWKVLVIWECWTRNPAALRARLEAFLTE